MNSRSHKFDVKQSLAVLKVAYRKGSLKRHPSQRAVIAAGHEVLASWGSAMRR
jgi:hypothetical protein